MFNMFTDITSVVSYLTVKYGHFTSVAVCEHLTFLHTFTLFDYYHVLTSVHVYVVAPVTHVLVAHARSLAYSYCCPGRNHSYPRRLVHCSVLHANPQN